MIWERRGRECSTIKTRICRLPIRESLYDRFKILCKAQKKMPAAVIKEFIRNYVSERKDDYEKITDYEH